MRLTSGEIRDDRLAHYLGLTIRTVCLKTSRLGDRDDGGRAVDSRAGRVDKARGVELRHDLEEEDRRGDVVLIVRQGDLRRLANGLVGLHPASTSIFSIWLAPY